MSAHRILIVDDNLELAENLAEILESRGFAADVFGKPREALAAFAPGRYAVALLDIRMPGLDGIELYGALRKKDPGLPAIAMTAYTTDERLRDALDAGMVAVVAKPVEILPLLARLSSIAGGELALVVDDDAALAQNLAEVLADRGFSVRVAHSCAEARRVIAAVPVSVALVDWRLPDGDGMTLVEQTLAGRGCTVVLFSGISREYEAARARASSAGITFLEKPVAMLRLLELVQTGRAKGR